MLDPEIRFGKPCIIGTRIAVTDILRWLASVMTNSEILEDYLMLKEEHIRAAPALAAVARTPSHSRERRSQHDLHPVVRNLDAVLGQERALR